VEGAIREFLIPALLDLPASEIKDDFRALLGNGVKQGGLNIRYPTKGADRLHQASQEASEVLAASLMKKDTLDLVEHKGCVRAAGARARKERVEAELAEVKRRMVGASKATQKRLGQIG
jgi:hypothetical protein